MNKNFKVIIGIEIHIQLNTKSKMFSSAPNDFYGTVNKNISVIDLGYPGTMPTVNKLAVIKAIKLAKSLKMKINDKLLFDRKHYFYPDLPKGFQITQHQEPIGKDGQIMIDNKKIEISRLQLEEDTAKSIHYDKKTLLNYNRAGIPLIEIITSPVISSAAEAGNYITAIRQLVRFLEISDAKMEEGSLRADLNISITNNQEQKMGTKVEIKNVNSISNAIQAIDLEILEQKKQILKGSKIEQMTKYYDDKKNENIAIRIKNTVADYKYFPEPNIPPINLKKEFVDSIKVDSLPWDIFNKFKKLGVDNSVINQLIDDKQKLLFIDKIKYHNLFQSVKIFFAEIVALANKENKEINELEIDPLEIKYILNENENGNISGAHMKKIIPLLIGYKKANDIIEKYKFKQISDKKEINEMIDVVISKNIKFINQNKNKKDKVCKFIIGQVMKLSEGQVNPIVANKLIEFKLSS